MAETSPMQIQNDFSSVRHGNELSPSQSRVDNESEFDLTVIAIILLKLTEPYSFPIYQIQIPWIRVRHLRLLEAVT